MPKLGSAKEPIRITREPEALAPWRKWMLSNLLKIAKAAGAEIQIDGAKTASNSDGAKRFRIDTGASSAALDPLYVETNGVVTAGTIGGVTPTIGGDPLDDSPPPALTIGSGTKYIVVTINLTLEVDAGVYVEGYSAITSVVIAATTTDPGSAGMLSTDGEFKFKIATFVDGAKTAQFITGSKSIQVCDDGTGDARGALNLITM